MLEVWGEVLFVLKSDEVDGAIRGVACKVLGRGDEPVEMIGSYAARASFKPTTEMPGWAAPTKQKPLDKHWTNSYPYLS